MPLSSHVNWLQPTKEIGHDTSTPLGLHVRKIGWFQPIIEITCDQDSLKNSRYRWCTVPVCFVSCATDCAIKAVMRIVIKNNKQKFKFKNWYTIMKFSLCLEPFNSCYSNMNWQPEFTILNSLQLLTSWDKCIMKLSVT